MHVNIVDVGCLHVAHEFMEMFSFRVEPEVGERVAFSARLMDHF